MVAVYFENISDYLRICGQDMGNVILILVVNIVTCLFLKGYTFISVKHETKF